MTASTWITLTGTDGGRIALDASAIEAVIDGDPVRVVGIETYEVVEEWGDVVQLIGEHGARFHVVPDDDPFAWPGELYR